MKKELQALENIKHYDNRVGLHEKDYTLIEDVIKAIYIIKEKLMYEIEPFDFTEYDTYEDYYQNYFEQKYEDEDDYPDWWLTEDEFNVLKRVFSRR